MYSLLRRDRRGETILWTPLAQIKCILEVCRHVRLPPLSVLVLSDHSFQERTALAFLGVYLDALDDELLA